MWMSFKQLVVVEWVLEILRWVMSLGVLAICWEANEV
jgi:hypothetical protein